MISYLQHGGFYEWLSVAILVPLLLVYVTLITSGIIFSIHLYDTNRPIKAYLMAAFTIISFSFSLASFAVAFHR